MEFIPVWPGSTVVHCCDIAPKTTGLCVSYFQLNGSIQINSSKSGMNLKIKVSPSSCQLLPLHHDVSKKRRSDTEQAKLNQHYHKLPTCFPFPPCVSQSKIIKNTLQYFLHISFPHELCDVSFHILCVRLFREQTCARDRLRPLASAEAALPPLLEEHL